MTSFTAAPSYTNSIVAAYNTRTPTLQIFVGTQTSTGSNVEVDINVVGSASSTVSPATDVATWYTANATYLGTLGSALKRYSSYAVVVDIRWN